MRPRDRDRGTGGGLRARRQGGRLLARLHLPQGVRDQAAPRGPGPPDDTARPPRRRARRGELGRGVRGDRPAALADPVGAREERGRRLPRQPERAQPVGDHARPGVAARARHPEPLLGLHGRPDAEAGLVRSHVRHDAVRADPGRGPVRPPAAPRREPAGLERQPPDRAEHARAAARHPRARRQGRGDRPAPHAHRGGGGRAPLHPPRARTRCCWRRSPARSSRRDSTTPARWPST